MSSNMLLDKVLTIKRSGCALKSEVSPYLFNSTLVYATKYLATVLADRAIALLMA